MARQFERFTCTAAGGNQTFNVDPQYHFATIYNNTQYTVTIYGGTLAESSSNEIATISPYNYVTVPLPDGTRRIKTVWPVTVGAPDATIVLILTESNLGFNTSLRPGSGTTTTIVADLVGLAKEATLAGVATEVTLAAILAALPADPATQTTLAAILAKLSADQATETTLAAILAAMPADPSTETTLAAILAKLTADPATDTTLATLGTEATLQTILAKLIAAPATEATLAAIQTLIDNMESATGAAVPGHALYAGGKDIGGNLKGFNTVVPNDNLTPGSYDSMVVSAFLEGKGSTTSKIVRVSDSDWPAYTAAVADGNAITIATPAGGKYIRMLAGMFSVTTSGRYTLSDGTTSIDMFLTANQPFNLNPGLNGKAFAVGGALTLTNHSGGASDMAAWVNGTQE